EELGIKEFLPPFVDSKLEPGELATGVCFASGGAGYDPLTAQSSFTISLSGQLGLFREYIGKLKAVVGEERTKFILKNTLYIVVLGSNDISNTYFLTSVRQLQYPNFSAYADFMLSSASTFLKEIYGEGARRIAVFSVPPLGYLPSQRTVGGGIRRDVVVKINDAVQIFNTKLSKQLESLNHNLPDSRMVYIDVYNPLLDIIVNYQKYGYKVGDRGCCGTGTIEVVLLCNRFTPLCSNDLEYVFWDSFHPTETEELGVKEFLPAYLDPNLQPDELATGVCFASGGAGYDPLTSQTAGAITLSDQLQMFKEYTVKLNQHVGENRTNFILSNALFFVVLGTNDISNTYFLSHLRQLQYDVPAYSDFLVNSASDFFKEIYELGARKIGVLSGPPVGCVPYHRTLSGGIERKCIQRYNDAMMLFNDKLSKEIRSLNQKLPNSRIVYIDAYNPLLDIFVNHQKYGYEVGDRGCCGTGTLEVALTCNRLDATCPNVLEYVFWDGFHPTESVYKKLVPIVLQNHMHQFQ
ncbi:hypothetical protein V8G54_037876, partial (chloroplast) [Vigna mungo]